MNKAPTWLTSIPEEAGFLAVLLPGITFAHILGNRAVDGSSRRTTGLLMMGAGLFAAAVTIGLSQACGGDKRGLCAMVRSPEEMFAR